MKIWWKDSFMSWPSLRLQIHVFPWHWHIMPRGWIDHTPRHIDTIFPEDSTAGWWGATGQWLFLEADLGFNLTPFTLEKETS